MDPAQQPRFVVLEGLDGTGTTTQAGLLADALRLRGHDVVTTAEPSDGPLGPVLRAHLRREVTLAPNAAALTFTADRADHLERTIRPALRRGATVVCDRYLLSTLAYQGAEGVDLDRIIAASAGFDTPDVTVVLDPPEDVRVMRLDSRGSRERYEATEMAPDLRRCYAEAIEVLRRHGHRIVTVTDGGHPDEVLLSVLEAVDAR